MPLLSDDQIAKRAKKRATFRLKTAGTKLNSAEVEALDKHCKSLATTPGEFIRSLILAELRRAADGDITLPRPEVAEIIGVRLLLVNVLRPLASGQKMTPEAFDKLLDDISKAKHELAAKLTAEIGR
jgi:hypothetical protein